MSPNVPLDVQWFAYALTENGVFSLADLDGIIAELGGTPDLESFAGSVVERLCTGLSDADAQSVVDQIQPLVDYACEQAATGAAPEFAAGTAPVEEIPAAAEPASSEIAYEAPEIDLSAIHGYEDLPSLSDTSQLSDDEVAQRMMTMLASLRALGCSDFHVSAGAPAFVRRQLRIERIDSYVLTAEDAKRLNTVLLSQEDRENFEREQDYGLALSVGSDRFRVCLMEQKEGVSGSYRLIPDHILGLEELGFSKADSVTISRLLDYHNGLILVTGPVGSGKTTTLASLIDITNQKRKDHVISVEDPIEIIQNSINCQVTQREVGKQTESYRRALKAALREDPDIIVISELHDLETIENAITASETGHLVVGTLHTGTAPNTLNRLLDVFPPSQQAQIRAMTAGSLRGIICQKLIDDGLGGVTMIYELMLNTMSVANLISEGKTFLLASTMATSQKLGMCTFDQCLLRKYEEEKITPEVALSHMHDANCIDQLKRLWAKRTFAAQAAAQAAEKGTKKK